MTQITVHSQNLRGSMVKSLDSLSSLMQSDCECTAIVLQDIGMIDTEGNPILRRILGDHKILVNFSDVNKARTVGIIINKAWNIEKVLKDKSGSLIGALISKGSLKMLVISAYMPATLDNYGAPSIWDAKDRNLGSSVQEEAHSIYCTLREWTMQETYWVVAGDLNETRSQIDRKTTQDEKKKDHKFSQKRSNQSSLKKKNTFVTNFLDDASGVDVWRSLFPEHPGFTHRNDKKSSFSRLDYFIISNSLMLLASSPQMAIGNWEGTKDHARISLSLPLKMHPLQPHQPSGKAWSIPQPELKRINPEKVGICKRELNVHLQRILLDLQEDLQTSQARLACADAYSKLLAQHLVDITGSILGMKLGTHKKGKYESLDISKTKAQISTIRNARDLIRTLYLDEVKSDLHRKETTVHLQVLLDRLCRMGTNIPHHLRSGNSMNGPNFQHPITSKSSKSTFNLERKI
jgi:exonuclease III